MQFILDHLEGFVSSIALIVSIIGAGISRSVSKKDMLIEQRADFNKEIYYTFIDLIFEFLELCSPEFVDSIYDSVLDEYQFDTEESSLARIDKAYVEISRRKTKLKLLKIKIETYALADMQRSDDVMDQINQINTTYSELLNAYQEELKLAFNDNVEIQIDGNRLTELTNTYKNKYDVLVDWVKKYMQQMKLQLLS